MSFEFSLVNIMAPPKGYRSFGYIAPDGQPEQISDKLIAFVSKSVTAFEPPRKRQKMALERSSIGSQAPEDPKVREELLDFIVVKEATWEIECPGSRLSNLVVRRQNIKPLVVCSGSTRFQDGAIPRHVEIKDDNGEVLRSLLIPEDNQGAAGFQDVYTALQVHENGGDSARGEGKVFVEFGISLFQREGSDYLGTLNRVA